MSHSSDVVNAWYEAAWADPPASTLPADQKYLADDFKSYDQNGNVVMDKQAMLGMNALVNVSFTDFKTVYHEVKDVPEGVFVRFHFEGKHTGDLDLSAMGLGVVKASGKMIRWPDASTVFTVKGDQIDSEHSIDSGVAWFLAPLGIKLPTT